MSAETPPSIRFPDDSGRSLAEVIAAAPNGATVELAPGRYDGPLKIDHTVHLRGAGDLTRIGLSEGGPVLVVDGPKDEWIEVSSVLLEGGTAEHGAGIRICGGRVRLYNIHVQNCEASVGGGAVAIQDAEVEATKLRAHDVRANEGGAVWVGEDARLTLLDSQIEDAESQRGGAIAVRDRASASLVGVTIRKARALSSSGGQAFYISGDPQLTLERVRLEDAPLGQPLALDAEAAPTVRVTESDVPRILLDTPGVVDGGGNHWR